MAKGQTPACVEMCKAGALTYEEMDAAMRRKTRDVARSMSTDAEAPTIPAGMVLLKSIKQSEIQLSGS